MTLDRVPSLVRYAPVFLVADTSADMRGEKIGVLNSLAAQVVEELTQAEMSQDWLSGLQKTIAVLEFNTAARWVEEPRPLDKSFQWMPLTAGGKRCLAPALEELNEKLSRQGYIKDRTVDSLIVFILSGQPEDDWVPAMFRLRENAWYKKALKIGFSLDERAADALAVLTGTREAVLTAGPAERQWEILSHVFRRWPRPRDDRPILD